MNEPMTMASSNFGWYCPDCGTNHANTTAACPRLGQGANTAGALITDNAPFTGYGIRKCRGHWHVTHFDNGVECEFDLSIPGDPFKTREAALDAADALNRDPDAFRKEDLEPDNRSRMLRSSVATVPSPSAPVAPPHTKGQISYAEVCREAAAKDENVADQLMAIDEPDSAREYLQSAAALRALAKLIEKAEQLPQRYFQGHPAAGHGEPDRLSAVVRNDWREGVAALLTALQSGFHVPSGAVER